MTESSFWFGDVDVKHFMKEAQPFREALLCFHGFPGQPPRGQEAKYAGQPRLRVELAKAACGRLRFDAYLPGYEGLGESRGNFSFVRSVTQSVALARDLAKKHHTLHVAGHSWGAFVAVNAYRAVAAVARPGRLLLYAGLLDLPDENAVRGFLPEFFRDYPEIMGSGAAAQERAFNDLDEARRKFNPLGLSGPSLDGRALLLHGPRDAAVSVEVSRRFAKLRGGRLFEPDDDHAFAVDMPRAVNEGLEFLSS